MSEAAHRRPKHGIAERGAAGVAGGLSSARGRREGRKEREGEKKKKKENRKKKRGKERREREIMHAPRSASRGVGKRRWDDNQIQVSGRRKSPGRVSKKIRSLGRKRCSELNDRN